MRLLTAASVASSASAMSRYAMPSNRHMVNAARRVQLARKKFSVPMRTAAYIGALEQIGDVYKLRGIFP